MFQNLQGVKMANCPYCGNEIPSEVVKEILREILAKAGSVKTAKKTASSRINAAKATAANLEKYTTDRRKEAAKRAWETRRAKKKQDTD